MHYLQIKGKKKRTSEKDMLYFTRREAFKVSCIH